MVPSGLTLAVALDGPPPLIQKPQTAADATLIYEAGAFSGSPVNPRVPVHI